MIQTEPLLVLHGYLWQYNKVSAIVIKNQYLLELNFILKHYF
jgi:hypothetical protein